MLWLDQRIQRKESIRLRAICLYPFARIPTFTCPFLIPYDSKGQFKQREGEVFACIRITFFQRHQKHGIRDATRHFAPFFPHAFLFFYLELRRFVSIVYLSYALPPQQTKNPRAIPINFWVVLQVFPHSVFRYYETGEFNNISYCCIERLFGDFMLLTGFLLVLSRSFHPIHPSMFWVYSYY